MQIVPAGPVGLLTENRVRLRMGEGGGNLQNIESNRNQSWWCQIQVENDVGTSTSACIWLAEVSVCPFHDSSDNNGISTAPSYP